MLLPISDTPYIEYGTGCQWRVKVTKLSVVVNGVNGEKSFAIKSKYVGLKPWICRAHNI